MATAAMDQAPMCRAPRVPLPAEFRSQMPTRRRRGGVITTGRAWAVPAGPGDCIGDVRFVRRYLPGVRGRSASRRERDVALRGPRGRSRIATVRNPDGVMNRVGSAFTVAGVSATPSQPGLATASWVQSARAFIAPLALAQFICSFAGSNMNVMINDISHDLHTDVKGVQTTITLFLLIMAVLMIPCSKLTDRWGRKRCFVGGLILYGIGTVLSAIAPNLGVLILGNSVFQGVGTAFLIPPVYILTTMAFTSLESRAKAFGVISGMGGIGAAMGPLIGGVITSGISWRAAFVFQALVVGTIILLSRRVVDPVRPDPKQPFDAVGAILSAAGMFFLVLGILQAGVNNTLLVIFLAIGIALLAAFYLFIRSRERAGKDALLHTDLFRNRTSNLGLVTQNLQWLLLMGVSFVVSVFLQTERHYSAIKTGVIFTAATLGVLVSSLAAERLAKRRQQKTLIAGGFAVTAAGIALLLGLVKAASSSAWAFAPGLLLIGLGLGVMLTPSVNLVQSAFPEEKQGEISGLSRSVSNLGSSFGTAIAGTILVSNLVSGNGTYVAAMIVLAAVAFAGLGVGLRLPSNPLPAADSDAAAAAPTPGALDTA
jgi:MFS family permease